MRGFFSSGGGFSGTISATLLLLGTGYFLYAALEGDYGKFRQMQLLAEKQVLAAQLDDTIEERKVAENRVRRLSNDYLDMDLLDERARDVLGHMRADEIVIQ